MNSNWWSNRLSETWNANEKCVSYLCDPTTSDASSNQAWASYFDSAKANYVIGSPSVEMFVKSYNQVSHMIGNYTLGTSYKGYVSAAGYIYTLNGVQSTISNSDNSTGTDSLDYTGYNSMYCGLCGEKGACPTWLSSPAASNSMVCFVDGFDARLSIQSYYVSFGISPLVSLKSDFFPEVEI